MATYLIDYENTHWHGLVGIDKLTENDYVVVFIRKAMVIPLDAVITLTKSKAEIVWKVFAPPSKPIPDYLDRQLDTYLGSLIGADKGTQFAIISKDHGYTAVCDFWRVQRSTITVFISETIATAWTLLEPGAVKPIVKAGVSTAPVAQPAPNKPVAQPVAKKTVVQPVVKKPVNKVEKIKPSIKKKVGEILKTFNLAGGNFATVYSVFRESRDEIQFCSGINKSFSKTLVNGKHNDLAMRLAGVYREFRMPGKG